jgi:GDPmannose 4,6-dehydratase
MARCKKVLITGVCGQDGAYLAKLLLDKGYDVTGGTRRSSLDYMYRLNLLNLRDKFKLINLDLSDPFNIQSIIVDGQYDEIYNLAAQSFVGASWETPIQTSNVDAMGPLILLDAIKRFSPQSKFYQASTSELYGKIQEPIQNEETPFYPRSPYAVAKQFAHSMTINYRESFGLFACCGILFNHESPLRGSEFVTKKITATLSRMRNGSNEVLQLGNIYAKRDWGYAKEYVEGMWLMLQQDTPEEYVLATGVTTTIKDFVNYSLNYLEYSFEWVGEGLEEKCIDTSSGKILVEINSNFHRPAEVEILLGNADKAKQKLGWSAKVSVKELAKIMVDFDSKNL